MAGETFNMNLLVPIVVLAVSKEVCDETFPNSGSDATRLYRLGMVRGIPPEAIGLLAGSETVSAFRRIQEIWKGFSNYTEPPCPEYAQLETLVTCINGLGSAKGRGFKLPATDPKR